MTISPWGGHALGRDEIIVTGHANAACRWTRDGGFVEVFAPSRTSDGSGYGSQSISGAGDDVRTLSRSGEILRLQADGGFETVYDAPYTPNRLAVTPAREVWAVGANAGGVPYFDGGSWSTVPLPTTELPPDVVWEGVAVLDEGVILSGFDSASPDGGQRAVVKALRRFGR